MATTKRKPERKAAGQPAAPNDVSPGWASDYAQQGQRQRSDLLRKAAARIRAGELSVGERDMIAMWLERLAGRRVAADIFHVPKPVGRPKGDKKARTSLYEGMPTDDASIAYYHWWMVNVRSMAEGEATAAIAKNLGISASTVRRACDEHTDVEAFERFQKRGGR